MSMSEGNEAQNTDVPRDEAHDAVSADLLLSAANRMPPQIEQQREKRRPVMWEIGVQNRDLYTLLADDYHANSDMLSLYLNGEVVSVVSLLRLEYMRQRL